MCSQLGHCWHCGTVLAPPHGSIMTHTVCIGAACPAAVYYSGLGSPEAMQAAVSRAREAYLAMRASKNSTTQVCGAQGLSFFRVRCVHRWRGSTEGQTASGWQDC